MASPVRYSLAAAHAAARRLAGLAAAALVACGGGAGDTPRADAVEEDLAADTAGPPAAAGVRGARDARTARPGFIPTGDPNAQTQGVFGPVLDLPLMPIHQVLLPDGRVLFYGSDVTGKQGASLHYAVWDPSLGTGPAAFTVLPQVTGTNIFCAGQSLLPDTGDVLIVGGDTQVGKVNGWGVSDVNRFSTGANRMIAEAPMAWRRWYPSLLTLTDGEQLALGGRMDAPTSPVRGDTPATFASTPEAWSRGSGWRALTAANSDDAYGAASHAWYYPRGWVAPSGDVFILTPAGHMYRLQTAGAGALSRYGKQAPAALDAFLQSVMYRPGRILSVRSQASTIDVDINGAKPVVTALAPTSRVRHYGNGTLLADGRVWLNGGSAVGNVLEGDWFVSEAWDPATGAWSDMATAAVPRLYHSSALLLPDATVITGGGGDPGPVTNLNAEIYYPAYLYLKDGSGTPAPRPVIAAAPDVLGWNQPFTVTVAGGAAISRMTLVRSGVVTHDFNQSQRFQELAFTQSGATLKAKSPWKAAVAPPGYYLLFVFDTAGVPSVAKVLRIGT